MDNQILAALITGLTTGGLSCMVVQGGLVTTSLANRLETDLKERAAAGRKKGRQPLPPRPGGAELAQPILLFLMAKLFVHTLLGLLLGALGSVFSLSSLTRGILQAAIGIFMLGNALRMLNVHPIFRYFTFEPPAKVTRYIRRTSKSEHSQLTPLFLGLLSVLIPCGVTQTMMALAVASGSPLLGAAIMFAFTLGASPVFFGLVYAATRLGALLEKQFTRVVAIVLIVLGVWTVDAGLNMMGSPVSISKIPQLVQEYALGGETGPGGLEAYGPVAASSNADVIDIAVEDYGYRPQRITAPAGVPITLNLTTAGTRSCSRAFTIPALDYAKILPATGVEQVQIPPQKAGVRLQFACSMGMYTGVIVFQ